MIEIYIRPLEINDAKTSYKWRNNPNIWRLTKSCPDKNITLKMELKWIKEAIARNNERRFAICLSDSHQYIGNVQLTHIQRGAAEFHIFIGEADYWGKNIGKSATRKLLEYAFCELKLESVYLLVKKDNIRAIKVYLDSGFTRREEIEDEYLMSCERKKVTIQKLS